MIDERQQELASLYAFDLLEGDERARFEAAVAGNPELRALVDEFRETASRLAHAAPAATPPPELKRRVLASVDRPAAKPTTAAENVIPYRAPSAFAAIVPWALAAGFALCAAWFGARYYLARSENARLGTERELAAVALKSAETKLEMERLTSGHLASDLASLNATSKHDLAAAEQARMAAETRFTRTEAERARIADQLAAAQKAAANAQAELVALNDRRQRESDLARLKIATLASMLGNSPKALAVAVWDPAQQQGVFTVDQLPANPPDQRYELWVIDKVPVSAGVFSVGPDHRAKLEFKPTRRIQTAAKFAVSLEKNDGQSSHATPSEVVMISE